MSKRLDRFMQNIRKLAQTTGKTRKRKHASNNLCELTSFLVFFSSCSSCDSCRYSAGVVWTARLGYGRPRYLHLCLEFLLLVPLHLHLASFYSGYGRNPFSSASQGQVYSALMRFSNQFHINFRPHPAPSVANRLPRIGHLPRPIPC